MSRSTSTNTSAGRSGSRGRTAKGDETITALRSQRGSSSAGRYRNEGLSEEEFCGPAGGAAPGTFPVNTWGRTRAALSYSRHAPDPAGVRECAIEHAEERRWMPADEAAAHRAYYHLESTDRAWREASRFLKQQQRAGALSREDAEARLEAMERLLDALDREDASISSSSSSFGAGGGKQMTTMRGGQERSRGRSSGRASASGSRGGRGSGRARERAPESEERRRAFRTYEREMRAHLANTL